MAADLSNVLSEEGAKTAETQANAKTEESTREEQPQATYRGRELEWRRTHGEVLRAFAGEWVVLEGEEIIVHGDDPIRVVAEARAKGIKVPYLFHVEAIEKDVVRIGL